MEDSKTSKLLSKNVAFMQTNDLEKIFVTQHIKLDLILEENERLWDMLLGLIELLEIDDSIVFELAKGENVDINKIKDATSIVQSFNIDNKFRTLIELKEDIIKEKFGANILKELKKGNSTKIWKNKRASELRERRVKKYGKSSKTDK